MLRRIINLATKEFIQLIRDRMMTVFIVLLPVSQLVLLAQAIGHGVNNLSLAIVDYDRSADSRALSLALDSMEQLNWRYSPADEDELALLLDEGRATVGLVIPSGFAANLAVGRFQALQVAIDGSNSAVAGSARSYVEGAVAEYGRRELLGEGGGAGVDLRSIALYNPGLQSRYYTIPAQIGFIIYQMTLAVAALMLARERELGTLEQLLVTPLRSFELITGKAVLAWFVGGFNFLFMYWIATTVFDVPMRGSFLLLLGFSLLFVWVMICFGVLISSVSRNQQQAILYVFLLAVWDSALSGYLVPVRNMPTLFRALAEVSPLQHYLVIVRTLMLKGAGIESLWPHAAAMLATGTVVGLVALRSARRLLE
ncbi:MAG: ABC transporter permease [Anaerolineae bacterium]